MRNGRSFDSEFANFISSFVALIASTVEVGCVVLRSSSARSASISLDVGGDAYLGCGKLTDKDLTRTPHSISVLLRLFAPITR